MWGWARLPLTRGGFRDTWGRRERSCCRDFTQQEVTAQCTVRTRWVKVHGTRWVIRSGSSSRSSHGRPISPMSLAALSQHPPLHSPLNNVFLVQGLHAILCLDRWRRHAREHETDAADRIRLALVKERVWAAGEERCRGGHDAELRDERASAPSWFEQRSCGYSGSWGALHQHHHASRTWWTDSP